MQQIAATRDATKASQLATNQLSAAKLYGDNLAKNVLSLRRYYADTGLPIDENELQTIEMIPSMFSSESDEFIESETGLHIYTIRLFDEDLPELTSEEEVEILYRILTKKELYRR